MRRCAGPEEGNARGDGRQAALVCYRDLFGNIWFTRVSARAKGPDRSVPASAPGGAGRFRRDWGSWEEALKKARVIVTDDRERPHDHPIVFPGIFFRATNGRACHSVSGLERKNPGHAGETKNPERGKRKQPDDSINKPGRVFRYR